MRTANTSDIIRNLGFGREQKLHCLTLQFQSRSPSEKPTDFSFSVFSRTEGQSDFSKICFSNWPLKLTHAKLRHSAVIWNWENLWLSILVCKKNLIGTFKKIALWAMLLAVSNVYSAQTLCTWALCFSRLNVVVWSFYPFVNLSNMMTLLLTSNSDSRLIDFQDYSPGHHCTCSHPSF